MSVDAFYSVSRRATDPASLFRGLCRQHGVTEVQVTLQPASLDDVDVAVKAFHPANTFTQVSCCTEVSDPARDLEALLESLPALPPPAGDLDALTVRYERDEATTALWPALGSRRKTPVLMTFAVGADLWRPGVALGVALNYSKVSRVSDAESAAIRGWWRARHHAFLDERLATLRARASFDLDWNEPRVISADTTDVSITLEWGHLSYPVVLVARPVEALLPAVTAALDGLGATRRVIEFQGPAELLTRLRPWLPPPSRIHGPNLWDPIPISDLELPGTFHGEVHLAANMAIAADREADLMLFITEHPRLVLAVRSGLLPKQEKKLAKDWRVDLVYEHD
jgi:hypothetical protein